MMKKAFLAVLLCTASLSTLARAGDHIATLAVQIVVNNSYATEFTFVPVGSSASGLTLSLPASSSFAEDYIQEADPWSSDAEDFAAFVNENSDVEFFMDSEDEATIDGTAYEDLSNYTVTGFHIYAWKYIDFPGPVDVYTVQVDVFGDDNTR